MEISANCSECLQCIDVKVTASAACPHCGTPLLIHATQDFHDSGKLDQCPLCGAAHLYRQKDFNRKLGIGIVILGVAASYFTYGISLVVGALIDWAIYKSVGEVACCYKCHAVFRGFSDTPNLEGFNLSFHDIYRSTK